MSSAYVYVLQSLKNKRLYYGSTNNLQRRMGEHLRGQSKYTKFLRPLELVYYEEFNSLAEARKRELFFKTGKGREFIKQKLNGRMVA
ncbi:TPA: endonuclease [Patescibacteria group bacterium]|nr:endonuclease [Patescibacteria group bacterium]